MCSGCELSMPSLVRSEHCVERASNRRPLDVGELCKTNSAEPSPNFAVPGLLSGGGLPAPCGHYGRPARQETPVHDWDEKRSVMTTE
jgi:hypothetical protein